jgi:PsbP-like protein
MMLLSNLSPLTAVSAMKTTKEVATSQTSLKTFESENFGFSLAYPKDWRVIKEYTQESQVMSTVAISPDLSGMNDNIREMVVVTAVHRDSEDYSLNDYIEESISDIKNLFGNAIIVNDIGDENISNSRGHSYLFSLNSRIPDIQLNSYQTFIIHGNQMYAVSYIGGAEYQHYFTIARDIMNSLHFNDIITAFAA